MTSKSLSTKKVRVDAIFVEIAFTFDAEAGVSILVGALDRRASETEEASVRQGRRQEGAEVFFLRAVTFIHQHDPVFRVWDRRLRAGELENGRKQNLAIARPRHRITQFGNR